MTTLVGQVDAAMADAVSDNPDVGEGDIHHDVAYGVCWVWHAQGGASRDAANEYWRAHFGESFTKRLTRPL